MKESLIIPPTEKELKEKYDNSRYKTEEDKECLFCKSKFKHGLKDTKSCGLCSIVYYCPSCNKKNTTLLNLRKIYSKARKNLIDLAEKNSLESSICHDFILV